MLTSPLPDQEGNKLQRTNSNFCKPLKKNFKRLSVQPDLRGSNDLRVGRKMATFQLLFQSGRAKDLSVPLYKIYIYCVVGRCLYRSGWLSTGSMLGRFCNVCLHVFMFCLMLYDKPIVRNMERMKFAHTLLNSVF